METTETLTEQQWQTVYTLAQKLANEQTDINEVGKIIAYLRAYGHQEKEGKRFFHYLRNLVKNGNSIGHSQKTIEYYTSIENACKECLENSQNDLPAMLQILGWVNRLMRYYKSGGSVIEADFSRESTNISRQEEIAKVSEEQKFEVGQVLDAEVTSIKNKDVTYEIELTKQKLSNKEPKKYQELSEGQKVKVKITELKENGILKKIKLLD